MILVHGREYGTAAQIAARLGGDVTVAMVRNWSRPDREGLVRHLVGRTVYYPLDQAATIERDKRVTGLGRPRRLDVEAVAAA